MQIHAFYNGCFEVCQIIPTSVSFWCWHLCLSFPIWVAVFLILHMPINFGLYPGYLKYYENPVLFNSTESINFYVLAENQLLMFRPWAPPSLLWAMFLISVLFLKLFSTSWIFPCCVPPSALFGAWLVICSLIHVSRSLVC